ncbi:rhodanese-like domain-containing protein [Flavisericum labens]|uniref:rhodanese-like domain-containing protein n=1 Tax=Flavisericum labens TaxID=3377112 RepID=UPI00387B0BCD
MKRVWLLAFLSVFIMNCQSAVDKEYLIEPETLNDTLSESDSVQLIDVRTPEEFKVSHIEGSKNYNFFDEKFVELISSLSKEKPVYLYCRSGKRSGKSIEEFLKLGFGKIYSLDGGIKNWESKGFKVSR